MISPVADKQSLFQLIIKHSDEIRSYGVRSLGVFGSFVRNQATEKSDVDVLVDFDPAKKTYNNFCDLAYFLEDLSGRKIDIVTPQGLSKYVGPYILKEVEYVVI